MRRIALLAIACVLASLSVVTITPSKAHAAFNKNLLIDDYVFSDSSSMNAAQIDAFLNGFANSCISPNSGFEARVPSGYSPSGGFTYGAFGSAGQVISTSAQVYGLNPQVLLVTLEKEQSLVTGRSSTTYCYGTEHKYAAAVGYGCPDSGGSYSWSGVSLYRRSGVEHTTTGSTCVNTAAKAGFSQQIIRAAWTLKFSQERSLGNTSWAVIQGSWDNSDDPQSCYSGFMTQGTLKRCPSGPAAYYDGWATIDSTATHMDTGATAALYRYTPHFHGNENFVSLFESWFGSTISSLYYACHNGTNIPGVSGNRRIIKNNPGTKADRLAYIALNNTSSACLEAHTWNLGQQTWMGNIATNKVSADPTKTRVLAADTNGDGRDELMYIKYTDTASGKIEIHTWDATYQHWASNVATNHVVVNPADDEIIAGDTNGDGRDELIFVKYRNTASGKIEIHTWNPGQQSWMSNVATNRDAVDPANTRVLAGDMDGDGRDELLYVKYNNTQSGMVEIHTWNPGQQSWMSNVATNKTVINSVDNEIITADMNSDGRDELSYIKYRNTASGKIEIHTWNPGQQSWMSNVATNRPVLAPGF